MKKRIFLSGLLISFIGCGFNTTKVSDTKDSITSKKNFLEGLKLLEAQHIDSLLRSNLFSMSTVPFYTPEGELIPFAERMNVMSSGKYNTQIYVNDKNEVKLWVAWLRTAEDSLKMNTPVSDHSKSELIGKKAKPFLIKDIDGKEYSLMDQKGKIIVMNFWFMDCYPCLQEIPELNKIVDKYKEEDVLFWGFALDKKEELIPFLKRKPFKYTVIPESESIRENYEVKTFPTHIIIDRDFTIKYYSSGAIKPGEKSDLERKMDELLVN